MSSIIIIPDELLTQLESSKAGLDAIYTFNPSTEQILNIKRLYNGNRQATLQIQMQFLQSSNQLIDDQSLENPSYFELAWDKEGETERQYDFIYVQGSPYSMAEFIDIIKTELAQGPNVTFVVDEDIMQNEGLFNLTLTGFGATISNISVTMYGYQLNQMLGTTHGTSDAVTWKFDDIVNQNHKAVRHYFMPVIKQMNFECTLQKKNNIYYDERNKQHNLISRVISSVQAGDFASVIANIDVADIEIEDLASFQIKVYDQNFMPCRFLDEFKICMTFQDQQGSLAGKLISNKSV